MKKLKFFGKGIYVLNSIAAFFLLVSFVLPYLPPSSFPTLSLLSLAVSPLIFVNLLFMVYWLLRLKKQFFISALVLIIAYFHFHSFYSFSSEGDASNYGNTLSILSYNVRLFNAYESNPDNEKVKQQISELIKQQNPDVICLQEYYEKSAPSFSEYPYKFVHFSKETQKMGYAIFSKYPLLNKGGFDFKDSYNNTIYTDVLVNSDTIRLYNLHLQSVGVLPTVDYLQENNTEYLKQRMSERFVQQENQVAKILAHKDKSKYPVILTGDFNNTPFSYVYRKLRSNMKDSFLERGNGLGTTYRFDSYPMRIDFILSSEIFEIISFHASDESFSDHYPIVAKFAW